jgi:hypothetical protein
MTDSGDSGGGGTGDHGELLIVSCDCVLFSDLDAKSSSVFVESCARKEIEESLSWSSRTSRNLSPSFSRWKHGSF